MSRAALAGATALFVAATLLMPSPAEARRGLVLITHGDAVKELADVPSEYREQLQELTGAKAPLKVGYFYSGFGIFGLDIWTWGGTYCLTAGDQYWPLDDHQVETLLDKPPSRPWTYSYPPGLLLIAGAIGVLSVYSIYTRKKTAALHALLEQLAQDPRYKQAVEQFIDDIRPPETPDEAGDAQAESQASETSRAAQAARGEEAFNRAVQYLVDRGVERTEAGNNLAILLSALAIDGRARAQEQQLSPAG